MASKAVKLKQRALSVVDTVHTLSSHNSSNSCTITVKSSPPRTATEMTKLSVRRGWMLKRNEQRSWQRRFCCLVPHTFLYYFESKDSEIPRGVIDLESYTDIGVDQGTGAIVLGPGADAPHGLRRFYFRPEDEQHRFLSRARRKSASSRGEGMDSGDLDEELPPAGDRDGCDADGEGFGGVGNGSGGDLGEWLSGLHRERFRVVRDERDAYMNLQEEYMAQMQDTTSAMSEAESKRGRVLQNLRAEQAAARAAARDGLEQARALFRDEDLPQEEASSLPLPALLARVRALASERRAREASLEVQLAEALDSLAEARREGGEGKETMDRLRTDGEKVTIRAKTAEARLQRAEEDAARERGSRAAAEMALEACKGRLEAALLDAEQGQVNLGIMAGERRAAVAKATELAEQKRLLVREIKATRRSLAEASSVNRRLARAYESLDRSLRSSTTSAVASRRATSSSTDDQAMGSPEDDHESPPAIAAMPGVSAVAAGGGGGHGDPGVEALPSPGSSAGSVGGLGGGAGGDDWREVRLSPSAWAGTAALPSTSTSGAAVAAPLGGAGRTRGSREPSSSSTDLCPLQVRNLSTGDVDVLGAVGARERAATEGGGAVLLSEAQQQQQQQPPQSPRAWQPHPSNLGLKITQSLASANWPWAAPKGTSEGESGSTDPPNGKPTGIDNGPSVATPSVRRNPVLKRKNSLSASAGAFMAGLSGGGGGGGSGGGVATAGTGHGVPVLQLDDDDDDEDDHEDYDQAQDIEYLSAGGGSGGGGLNAGVHESGGRRRSAGRDGSGEEERGRPAEEEGDARLRRGGSGGTSAIDTGAGAMLCQRCWGTVEGPLHSTCACAVPQLGGEQLRTVDEENSATPAGLAKLKGVFKSFNGKVEVARQILDAAVRQNMANNVPSAATTTVKRPGPTPPKATRHEGTPPRQATAAPIADTAVRKKQEVLSGGGGASEDYDGIGVEKDDDDGDDDNAGSCDGIDNDGRRRLQRPNDVPHRDSDSRSESRSTGIESAGVARGGEREDKGSVGASEHAAGSADAHAVAVGTARSDTSEERSSSSRDEQPPVLVAPASPLRGIDDQWSIDHGRGAGGGVDIMAADDAAEDNADLRESNAGGGCSQGSSAVEADQGFGAVGAAAADDDDDDDGAAAGAAADDDDGAAAAAAATATADGREDYEGHHEGRSDHAAPPAAVAAHDDDADADADADGASAATATAEDTREVARESSIEDAPPIVSAPASPPASSDDWQENDETRPDDGCVVEGAADVANNGTRPAASSATLPDTAAAGQTKDAVHSSHTSDAEEEPAPRVAEDALPATPSPVSADVVGDASIDEAEESAPSR